MAALWTLVDIDRAIHNLKYRNKTGLPYRLVTAIRQFYTDEASVESVQKIDSEVLMHVLWNTADSAGAGSKRRKQLSSVKSRVNKNLRNLYSEGNNPGGIVIGRFNTFVMCDEAKDKALRTLQTSIQTDGSPDLKRIAEILQLVNDLLPKPGAGIDPGNSEDRTQWDQIKGLIQGLSGKMGVGGTQPVDSSAEEDAPTGAAQGRAGLGGSEPSGAYEGLGNGIEDDQRPEDNDHFDEVLPEEEVIVEDLSEDAELDEEEPEDLEQAEPALEPEEVFLEEQEPEGQGSGADAGMSGDEAVGYQGGIAGEGLENSSRYEGRMLEGAQSAQGTGPGEQPGFEKSSEGQDLEPFDPQPAIEASEAVEVDEIIEEAEPEEREPEDDFEELEQPDSLLEDLNGQNFDGASEEADEIQKARLLAEEFNSLLGARDTYYNQYILIPDGTYAVGTKRPKTGEKLEKQAQVASFYMAAFPVTNGLFEVFVEKTGYRTTAEKRGYGTVYWGRFTRQVDEKTGLPKVAWNSALIRKTVQGACWYQPSGPGSTIHNKKNHPVVQVSLEDAMAFAAWTGKRLPTEDEWEAASRTVLGLLFPWGNDRRDDACNMEESSIGDTTAVDAYLSFANESGMADVVGNVWEWTSGRQEQTASAGHERRSYICKGGSWVSENQVSVCSRWVLDPESWSNILGFRCAAD